MRRSLTTNPKYITLESHRSWNMSQIRSKDTKPEIFFRKLLWSNGFRYRLHSNVLPGKPDIVLKKFKTSLFINGCFWHQHPGCKRSTMPKSNIKYWRQKLNRNVERQKLVLAKLEKLGWRVVTVWECQVKKIDANLFIKHLIMGGVE